MIRGVVGCPVLVVEDTKIWLVIGLVKHTVQLKRFLRSMCYCMVW